jgi:hypothetical protein
MEGAPVSDVAAHVSETGSYRPPVSVAGEPPQTIISAPVHTAEVYDL